MLHVMIQSLVLPMSTDRDREAGYGMIGSVKWRHHCILATKAVHIARKSPTADTSRNIQFSSNKCIGSTLLFLSPGNIQSNVYYCPLYDGAFCLIQAITYSLLYRKLTIASSWWLRDVKDNVSKIITRSITTFSLKK